MTYGSITSWQIDGETVETVTDFILGGSKITADGDCSHKIKRHLLFGGKVMINLESLLKSRDVSLPTEVCLVKAMVFLVVMYGCESWTIKKAECQRTDAFELWCWRRLLRVPWTAGRSNQSILKEISPEYSLEGLMLKLKLQYFGHLMWTDSFEKTLMLGKIEYRRWTGWQRIRWLDGITQWTWVWVNSGSWWWTGRPGMLQSMGLQRVRHDWATELTELNSKCGLNLHWEAIPESSLKQVALTFLFIHTLVLPITLLTTMLNYIFIFVYMYLKFMSTPDQWNHILSTKIIYCMQCSACTVLGI